MFALELQRPPASTKALEVRILQGIFLGNGGGMFLVIFGGAWAVPSYVLEGHSWQ